MWPVASEPWSAAAGASSSSAGTSSITENAPGSPKKAAIMVQSIPIQGEIPVRFPSYGLMIYYPDSGIWDRVNPIPEYPDGLPLFCQVVSSEGKLVVMGGLDPMS
ncbi:hypothetical protein RHGRI_007384 [Rhododendron griersonianum]|uniref:Uncharacterized protein n=1 Tax=Rhododendron griersonianum TaxID=479676 RepID=A0AAV6KXE8_9ERIC|nr:hypothetical protein RHGRI_007384 [Rhododendron griersonianum]